MSELNLFLSESENEHNEENSQQTKKRRNRNYKCIIEYETYQSSLERIKEPVGDSTFRYRFKKKTIEGEKDFYYCFGNQHFPKSLYILRHSDTFTFSDYVI